MLLNGCSSEVWMQPEVTKDTFAERFGAFYRQPSPQGEVVLVLGATLLVHPRTIRELGPALDRTLADLRFGAIGANLWNAAAFLLAESPWWAYPGHPLGDIQSGSGFVQNTFMLDAVEKIVVRGSFYPFPRSWVYGSSAFLPRPPWFVTNRTARTTARRITYRAMSPGYRHLPGIFASAMLG